MATLQPLIGSEKTNVNIEKVQANVVAVNADVTLIGQQMEHKADITNKSANWKTVADLPSSYPLGVTMFTGTTAEWQGVGGGSSPNITTFNDGSYGQCYQIVSSRGLDCLKYREVAKLTPNTWSGWQTIATTDKIDILCTPASGFKINENKSYKINNILYFNLNIAKTNDAVFTSNTIIGMVITDFSYKGNMMRWDNNLTASAMSANGTYYPADSAIAFENGSMYIGKILEADATKISIQGSIVINS